MPADIGQLIFADILGMTIYPGSPFTGNLVRDLIMFLFIPSVFIIVFVIVLLGRLAVGALTGKIRLLLGIALYLFIIAGGYYSVFALLAGPYFIFLIFILGLLYFIPSHFGARFHERGSQRATGLRAHGNEGGQVVHADYQSMSKINKKINQIERRLEHEPAGEGRAVLLQELRELERQRDQLEGKFW